MKVERQRNSFKREQKYICPTHKIYISPSTFEYEMDKDNLLWIDNIDNNFFDEIKKVKRESRIARDNSEDALTWNVFRFLDKEGLARIEFGETIARGSEPDIIIRTDKVLYFLEAKLTAKNETKPSNLQNRKKYEDGGNKLFQHIFKSDYETVAIKDERYELMRFWLLGSWMAKQLNLDFEFYCLVMQSKEKEIEVEFGKHIIKTAERKFSRLTWEQIYNFVKTQTDDKDRQKMTDYFEFKTIGYNSNGEIISAFNIEN